MSPRRTRLKIPGMCAEGPPSYSELETNDRRRLRREAALAQVSQDATYCVHYSSLRQILNSRDLADQIARYPEGDLTPIAYFHQVPADTPQDPYCEAVFWHVNGAPHVEIAARLGIHRNTVRKHLNEWQKYSAKGAGAGADNRHGCLDVENSCAAPSS